MIADETVAEILRSGGVGVLPTDTLYGVVASALNPEAVSRVYELKRRNPAKPCIVLISDIEAIEEFGVILSNELRERLQSYWPGPNSIILPTIDETFSYLTRDTEGIAFRVPDDDGLREFLRISGPLIAPSANIEGDAPATTISAARAYFGDDVDFYVDAGKREGKASTLIVFDEEGVPKILRE